MKYPKKSQTFYPWPDLLRCFGFSRSYILKDLLFKKEIGKLGLTPENKVLDVGCGKGLFLDRLVRSFKVEGVGIDISSEAIRTAKKETKKGQFIVAKATSLPFSKESFDLVFCLDTLEHIKQQDQALGEMMRVLKSQGFLFLYVMNKNRRLTFEWFLISFFNLLGIDAYRNVGHFPKLFLEEGQAKDFFKKNKLKLLNCQFFHSFFTEVFDSFLLGLYFLFFRTSFLKSNAFGKMVFRAGDLICRVAFSPLWLLDLPWRLFGQSNGLLLIGKKS